MKIVLFLFSLLLVSPAFAQSVEDGYAAYDDGDYEKAKSIFHALAEQGDAKAMNAIGILHAEGKGYPLNRNVACDWYEKAALINFPAAQFNYANCFGDKGGRKKSLKQWRFWKEKAGEQGYLPSQTMLMTFYFDTNRKKAIYWAKKAAAQNSTAARVALWSINEDQDIAPVSFGEITCVLIKLYALGQTVGSCD